MEGVETFAVHVDCRGSELILRRLDAASRDLVWAYDAYVSIPDTTAATFFPGERISVGG